MFPNAGVSSTIAAMHAYVYKSLKRADTYVYLAARDDFARLRAARVAQLGR